ncbi:MAG: DUF2934 domain-containing protein [Verrucomicrobiales bacterium]|nr:DUF2934 domain-containing protein [Verrucomicrobiales bacterium]
MNTNNCYPADYYQNGLVSPEDVRALAQRLSLERGDVPGEGSQHWLEAEAWFRFRNSEGGDPVWS